MRTGRGNDVRDMKIVVFGLTISSSWGNGHATLWRGLCKALRRKGCRVVFFERDVPYYADARDMHELPGGHLVLYPDWESIETRARSEIGDADAAIVTSFCPDGIAAAGLATASPSAVSVFYDLDTPVTLAAVSRGETVPYIGPRGLGDFDLVLSFTGGPALAQLRSSLGARLVVPLYGHVDPDVHRPAAPRPHYRSDLGYLGTYSADRQEALENLLLCPARRRPDRRFLIAGAQYPQDFPWCPNIYFVRHLPPPEHAAFFSSARLALNLTRSTMARMGWCPSGRLFEATACGAPVLTDRWDGLDTFFTPNSEILVAGGADDAIAATDAAEGDLARIGRAGRERTLDEHTSDHRARALMAALELARPSARLRQTAEA
jgi:spore maturation protein CgeB